jgi:hypothetical protein
VPQVVQAQRAGPPLPRLGRDLDARLAEHRSGPGARMLAAAITRTWPGNRTLERRLQNRKNAPDLCPVCARATAARRGAYA